ncbi:MAG: CbrC family protein [Candidatus Saccharibacteria bacterium]
MTKFKYFENPEKYAVMLDGEHECDICNETKKCLDASLFYGDNEYSAFCMDCVSTGCIRELGAFGVDPDAAELRKQLKSHSPSLNDQKIEDEVKKLNDLLMYTTPHVPTWQDFFWPAHCADYCQYIGVAGQAEFCELAESGDGKDLFESSLYGDLKDITDIDEVWDGLKKKKITDPHESWSPMAYLFRCTKCGALITIWDCD